MGTGQQNETQWHKSHKCDAAEQMHMPYPPESTGAVCNGKNYGGQSQKYELAVYEERYNQNDLQFNSHHALGEHGAGDFEEAGDVGADHQVAGFADLDGGVVGGVEDVVHDALQLLIDLFEAPGEAHGVLRHLKTAGGHAAGVRGLAGAVRARPASWHGRDGVPASAACSRPRTRPCSRWR